MSLEDRNESPSAHAKRLIAQAIIDSPYKPALREAILDYANLSDADLSKFDFRFTQFHDCNLRGTKLPQTIPHEGEPDYSDALRNASDPPVPGWQVVSGRMQRSLTDRPEPQSKFESKSDYPDDDRDKNGIDRDGSEWFSEDDE